MDAGTIIGERYVLDRQIGERGRKLSGGQGQRLMLARALVHRPQLLILDEATSHLDTRSEALIQEALERLMTDRTSLVIAHRLSTIRRVDRILVFDAGRGEGQGLRQSALFVVEHEAVAGLDLAGRIDEPSGRGRRVRTARVSRGHDRRVTDQALFAEDFSRVDVEGLGPERTIVPEDQLAPTELCPQCILPDDASLARSQRTPAQDRRTLGRVEEMISVRQPQGPAMAGGRAVELCDGSRSPPRGRNDVDFEGRVRSSLLTILWRWRRVPLHGTWLRILLSKRVSPTLSPCLTIT